MAILKICAGCGVEMDMKSERVHPQRNDEYYCDPCNKKYEVFVQARKPIFEDIDTKRIQALKALKKSIFGDRSTAKITEEEKEAILAKAKQDQSALNKAKTEVAKTE